MAGGPRLERQPLVDRLGRGDDQPNGRQRVAPRLEAQAADVAGIAQLLEGVDVGPRLALAVSLLAVSPTAGHNVVHHSQQPARPQHTRRLGQEVADVGKVVGGDAAGDQVKCAVERQVVHVAYCESDVGCASLFGQPRRQRQHLRRQV